MSGSYDDRQAMTPEDRERFNATLKDLRETIAAAPAPQAEPREMTQAEYEVEYAKLCEKYNELLKFKAGAAPAETAPKLEPNHHWKWFREYGQANCIHKHQEWHKSSPESCRPCDYARQAALAYVAVGETAWRSTLCTRPRNKAGTNGVKQRKQPNG